MSEAEYFDKKFKKIKSKVMFKGKILNLRLDEVELPNGKIVEREVVEHKGAVGIVPVTSDNEVVLIKQYRYPIDKVIWEIPAGLLDEDESPLSCAIRELKEETGYTAKTFIKMAEFYLTPGNSNEYFHLYLAKDLTEGDTKLEDDEFLELKHVSLENALKLVMSNEIKDAKTMIGFCLAEKILKNQKDKS
ncbi:NUDIX hydrolase [Candidatus Oleimmundimicrobium sp.]|uniref:NUDIX hydrolase n=1 Tax=Candidatus Oleimmundimicrobium sp. TaxID=3060597 RepID=UPI0027165E67|nr:NUDIX hydrolase [Candidatus Oleimmundimicrobium sp.]MDO8886534.1 NUDIX hydrolase [Candidatus Oleimmundimicrobium sp.]